MNFYISKENSLNTLYIGEYLDDYNVEIDDTLVDYIYFVKNKVPFNDNVFYTIDPYDDVVIMLKDIPQMIDIANYLLESSLLEACGADDAEESLRDLIELSQSAIRQKKNLISIGD